jgi:type IV pilus assembly protein PilE
MNKSRGFTLIEVLITVVIVGLLAAAVLPTYQSSVQKSRRADGRAALTDLAAKQEKFFAQNNSYTTEVEGEDGLNLARTTSLTGHYDLTVMACAGGAISRCYLLIGTATGLQADDHSCYTMMIDNVGRKTANNFAGDSFSECW